MNAGRRNLRKRKSPPPESARRGTKKQQRSRGAAAARSEARHDPEPDPAIKQEEEEEEEEAAAAGLDEVEEQVEVEEVDGSDESDESDEDEEPEEDVIAVQVPAYAGVPRTATSRRNAPGRSMSQSIVDMTFTRSEVSGGVPMTQQSLVPSEAGSSQRRSLGLNIHQLGKLAAELMASLEDKAQDGSFLVPRAAFEGASRLFPKVQGLSTPSPFIDPDEFVNVEPSPVTGASAVHTVHRVNLVIALDMIAQFFEDPIKSCHDDITRPIAMLDDYLYRLILPFGAKETRVNFAFDLRIVRSLEMMPEDNRLTRGVVLKTFSSVFCLDQESLDEKSGQDFLKNITEGPYRELCNRDIDGVEALSGRRLADIVRRIFRQQPGTLREVQRDYRISSVFEKLVDWLSMVYVYSEPKAKGDSESQSEEEPEPQREGGADGGREPAREWRTIRHGAYVDPSYPKETESATQTSQQVHGDEEASVASQPIVRLSDADP